MKNEKRPNSDDTPSWIALTSFRKLLKFSELFVLSCHDQIPSYGKLWCNVLGELETEEGLFLQENASLLLNVRTLLNLG